MSDLNYNTDNILSNFPPCLRTNVEELCLRSKIGLSAVNLNDISILPSKIINGDMVFGNYHYIIKIPYAGKRLKWEVIFDPEDFEYTPDFDFNDDDFLCNPDYDVIMNNIPSLIDWNLKNQKALAQVLNEFLLLYKKLQIEKLKTENIYSRYFEEYEVLISEGNGIEPQNIEVIVESNSITFLISLKVDCKSLPEYIQPIFYREGDPSTWYNPGEDFANLKISILKLDGSRANVTLQLSPRLEQVLGNSKNLHVPDYKKDIPLIEYVSVVAELIDNRIAILAEHFRMKKIYITSLVAICSNSIVEYDTESFNRATFSYNINNYTSLVTVTIGQKFPQEKPMVQLTSVYCQEGRNCNDTIERYPYNVDNSPADNINKLLEILKDVILRFKNHKH